METLKNLLCWNEHVESHPYYAEVGTTLEKVSEKDYPGTHYFEPDIAALDIDQYEKNHPRMHCEPTMDAVIGIKNFDGHQTVNPRLLLVELRMNYKSVHHLSVKELTGKVAHTRDLLTESTLSKFYIFVFTKAVAPQARHWFGRQVKGNRKLADYIAWSTDEFNQNILAPAKYPYVPYTDIESIKLKADQLILEGNADGLYELIKSNMDLAGTFRYKNLNESNAIIEALKEVWAKFTQNPSGMSECEMICKEMVEEDYKDLLS